mgnify:CR=1 FL=1
MSPSGLKFRPSQTTPELSGTAIAVPLLAAPKGSACRHLPFRSLFRLSSLWLDCYSSTVTVPIVRHHLRPLAKMADPLNRQRLLSLASRTDSPKLVHLGRRLHLPPYIPLQTCRCLPACNCRLDGAASASAAQARCCKRRPPSTKQHSGTFKPGPQIGPGGRRSNITHAV